MSDIIGKNHSILIGDVTERLRDLPDESVHMVVTSPPYWNLRSYHTAEWTGGDPECKHIPKTAPVTTSTLGGLVANANHAQHRQVGDVCPDCGAIKGEDRQIGLEETPQAYVDKLVLVFREIRRVLRSDGTVWLNLGDSYAAQRGSGTTSDPRNDGRVRNERSGKPPVGLKPKDLVGIPWMVAFALRADGWWLRQDIVWAKRVPMPESVSDRCTRSHEFIFHLAKAEHYFFDHVAIKEPLSGLSSLRRMMQPNFDNQEGGDKDYAGSEKSNGNRSMRKTIENFKAKIVAAAGEEAFKHDSESRENGVRSANYVFGNEEAMQRMLAVGRNKRDVWTLSTAPSRLGHFAQFVPQIPLTCIQAGTSERGCCPDCGAPWERLRARTPEENPGTQGAHFDKGKTGESQAGRSQRGPRKLEKFVGWGPTCTCYIDLEKHVCTRCKTPLDIEFAQPSQEELEEIEEWKQSCGADEEGEYDGESVKDFESGGAQDASDVKRRILNGMKAKVIMKWDLGCDCGLPELSPAVVMDVFHGSGTTGAVAEYLGRKYIGIELSKQYAQLYDARKAEVVRALIGGDAPERKGEKNDNQMGLFGGD